VILGASAELKGNPAAEGALRLMMLGLDSGVVDGLTGACTFTPRKEDAELAENEGAGGEMGENGVLGDVVAEDMGVNPGLNTGEDEHTPPVGVTVTEDIIRIVLVPSGPVEEKMEAPFGRSVGAGEVGTLPTLKLDAVGVGDDKGTVLEGTIPPKLNVLAADVELN
jgi:hypothetical protein